MGRHRVPMSSSWSARPGGELGAFTTAEPADADGRQRAGVQRVEARFLEARAGEPGTDRRGGERRCSGRGPERWRHRGWRPLNKVWFLAAAKMFEGGRP